jgi:tetratricopeptide (TPR) repeat protein/TolB-like protein
VLRLTPSGRWELDRRYDARVLPLPPGIRAAIKLRLSQLNEPARTLLHAVSALDTPFDVDSGRLLPGFDPEVFDGALHELLARRLLRLGSDGRTFEFTHALIRRIVAEQPSARVATSDEGAPPAVLARRIRNRRHGLVGAVVALTALGVVAGSLYLRSRSPDRAPFEPRVMVVPFTNQTGDPQFDPLARITADWITQGITHSGLVAVIPLAVGVGATNPGGTRGDEMNWPKLAPDEEPTLVISGAIYESDDSLRFDAQITDARRGKSIRSIEPVSSAAAQPMAGLEAMRQHVLASLGPLVDVRLASSAHVQSTPPSYEAYRAFASGLDLMYAREGSALAEFARAYALDSSFTLPLLYEAMTHDGMGRLADADSLARMLGPRRGRLAPYDRHLLDFVVARAHGDRTAEYAAARDAAALAPGSFAAVLLAPRAALALNLPGEAVRLLSKIDAEHSAANGLPSYWNTLAHAQHMLGHYQEQLAVAKEVAKRLPQEDRALYYEARALAALGRTRELDATLAAGLTWPSVPAFGPPGLGLHIVASEELRAHGHAQGADEILQRAVRFYEKVPAETRRIPRHRNEMARALYALGRLPESRAMLGQLVSESAFSGLDLLSITAQLAVVCAAQGDLRCVDELSRQLAAPDIPYAFGLNTFYRARIAAALGRREEAVRLLRQATSEGAPFGHTLHHIVEFQRLRGYAPFEEWLRPKG